jgi:hypothetical protein
MTRESFLACTDHTLKSFNCHRLQRFNRLQPGIFHFQPAPGCPDRRPPLFPGTHEGYASNDNYPGSVDNHGKDGGKVLFCDGHALCVQQAAYPKMWAVGTDEAVYNVLWLPY